MKHYENLSANLNAFFEAVNAEKAKNIAEANVIADEARALIARAQMNREKHEELCEILGAVADTVQTEYGLLDEVVGNIKDAFKDFYDSELPDCAVEDFAGYCADCGAVVLTADSEYSEAGELLCPTCYKDYLEWEEEEEEG